ncbi:MAG: AraC family ligand binding domain-containing protein, partial [Clostridia bacterium]|nr:AraC family ligand binding domain-containing protein [Clostridia bacterium]
MTRSPLEAFLQAAKTKKAYIEEQAEKGSRWHLFSCDRQERHGFGVMSSPHYHFDRYEMICGMEGVCVVTIEGTDYDLGPGDIVILKPGAVHGVVTESEYTAYVYLKFSPDLLRAQDSVDMHSFALYEAHSDTHLCFISHKQSGCKQIAEYLFTIYEECQRREFGYEMVVNGYICIMYACLMRLWYTSCIDNIDRINMSQSGVTILRKALDYIGKNITGELSLEAVAAHCGMQ